MMCPTHALAFLGLFVLRGEHNFGVSRALTFSCSERKRAVTLHGRFSSRTDINKNGRKFFLVSGRFNMALTLEYSLSFHLSEC
jgi:hypothetical protein